MTAKLKEIKQSLLSKIAIEHKIDQIIALQNYEWEYGERLIIKHAGEYYHRGMIEGAQAMIGVLLCAYSKT